MEITHITQKVKNISVYGDRARDKGIRFLYCTLVADAIGVEDKSHRDQVNHAVPKDGIELIVHYIGDAKSSNPDYEHRHAFVLIQKKGNEEKIIESGSGYIKNGEYSLRAIGNRFGSMTIHMEK